MDCNGHGVWLPVLDCPDSGCHRLKDQPAVEELLQGEQRCMEQEGKAQDRAHREKVRKR